MVQLKLSEGTFVRVLHAKLGQDPSEDHSIDLGFWIEAGRVITFRQGPPVPFIEWLQAQFACEGGPDTPWEFFALAVSHLRILAGLSHSDSGGHSLERDRGTHDQTLSRRRFIPGVAKIRFVGPRAPAWPPRGRRDACR